MAPSMKLTVKATDNSGAAVKGIEVLVDDVSATKAAGDALSFEWDTRALATGKHTVDVVAVNQKGLTSRRRFELFAGDFFLTELGTRYLDEGTQVTLRDIVPEGLQGEVRLEVRAAGPGAKRDVLFTSTQSARHGATAFVFGGKDASGRPFARGRYEATVSFLDEAKRPRQVETLVFVHDTREAQQARYAEVQGKLDLARDGSGAANALVELVDERGAVVQRVKSNAAGQYRFKNLDDGKYKVRVQKEGFRAEEAEVSAKAGAAPAAASVSLH